MFFLVCSFFLLRHLAVPGSVLRPPQPVWANSSATIATWTGLGIFGGSILTAIATGFFQPWLNRDNLQRDMDRINERVKTLETELDRERVEKAIVAEANRAFLQQLADLTRQNAELTQKNILLSGTILAREGRILPITPADASLIVSDQMPEGPGPHVLLVEDTPRTRKPMRLLMEAAGYRVDIVELREDALAFLEEHIPDIIVLDLMLPDGDGIEVLRRVRERHLPTKVVITTGKVEEQLEPVYDLSPDAVFTKPVDLTGKLLPTLKTLRLPSPTPEC